MISIRDFMETVNYRITEGSEYCWACYGYNAYTLDSWNGDNDNGYSVSIVFDTDTQTVYEMSTCDYKNQRAYRWIHPDYRNLHTNEAKHKLISINEAWDDVNFVDLEMEEDLLEKSRAIVAGEDYDTSVSIPIDLPDKELMVLFKMAHERNVTFNQFIEEVIKEALKEYEQDPEGMKKRTQHLKDSVNYGY